MSDAVIDAGHAALDTVALDAAAPGEVARLRGELAKARRKIETLERVVRRAAVTRAEREQRLVNLRDALVETMRRETARLAVEQGPAPVPVSVELQLARSIMARQRPGRDGEPSAPARRPAPAPAQAAPATPAPLDRPLERALKDIDALDRSVRDLQFKRARAQIDAETGPGLDRSARVRVEGAIIRASSLFDAEHYAKKMPDAPDGVARYLEGGLDEDVPPHPLFANRWYVTRYAKLLGGWLSPFAHFLEIGWKKGCDPHPLFKTRWYLAQNDDVKQAGVNPFAHYVQRGHREGRNPNPYFDTAWYRETYLFDALPGVNPLVHYAYSGKRGVCEPSSAFDTARLTELHPRVGLAQTNPLAFLLGLEQPEIDAALDRMRVTRA